MGIVIDATVKACTECKSNPQLRRKGTRKFEICYECRVAQVKEALAARKVRRVIGSSKGRVVQYYDQGWRYGYLVDFTQHTAIIQPVGPGPLARHMRVPMGAVQPSAGQSAAYPTLESYVASRPKETPKPPAPVRVVQVDMGAAEERVLATAIHAARQAKPFDTAKAVELFKGGMKIIDIAVQLGYPRGQGNNRTRKALREAGVLQ